MECKHAYFKDNVVYVLCDCDGAPKSNNLDEVTKYMCSYQRFCPNKRACALLPEWRQCHKLTVHTEQPQNVVPAVTQKATKKKKQ